jgi:hypothetical protein
MGADGDPKTSFSDSKHQTMDEVQKASSTKSYISLEPFRNYF